MKTLFKIFITIIILAVVAVIAVNLFVIIPSAGKILDGDEAVRAAERKPFDCICVLGCSAKNGVPSDMLKYRLDTAVALYKNGVCGTLLMSGDETTGYSEVAVMRAYAESAGVPADSIITDNCGFSTRESMRRLKEEFGFSRVVIVTQNYHMYRAVYLGEKFGVETAGVCADDSGTDRIFNNVREFFARCKDFIVK